MTRTDLLRSISAHVRQDRDRGLYAVAYLIQLASLENLEDLLAALDELREVQVSPTHLELVRERYGVVDRTHR